MTEALNVALAVAFAMLVVVLAMGIINLVRTDPNQQSRSNRLMRLRVLIQFIVIVILVAIGFLTGYVKLPW